MSNGLTVISLIAKERDDKTIDLTVAGTDKLLPEEVLYYLDCARREVLDDSREEVKT